MTAAFQVPRENVEGKMNTASYTFRLEDQIGHVIAVLTDFDVDVTFDVVSAEEPYVEVVSVFLTGARQIAGKGWVKVGMVDLLRSEDPFIRSIGIAAKSQIEDDDDWCAERIREAGWIYRGLGGNDPDGRFVLSREARAEARSNG